MILPYIYDMGLYCNYRLSEQRQIRATAVLNGFYDGREFLRARQWPGGV